ncbi:MAG: hypothetical protein CVU46_03365 [Chloroflexi bacterium HGW-Chloroflexi-8]|nr:MAG: hypothetical protein CVU46_03365 [Chloroflexi bacterium HGW-Chloroflexi-8]
MNASNKKLSAINKLLLFLMVGLAAYEVILGGNSRQIIATWAYTVGFGVLLISGLILILLGYDTFQRPLIVTIATIIPLAISMGLVADFFPAWTYFYLAFAIIGLFLVGVTRMKVNPRSASFFLAPIHGISGLVIFFTPILLSLQKVAPPGFLWITLGGALIGLGGLLLSFLRVGKAFISQQTILSLLPALLFFTTFFFVLGFNSIR